MNHRAEILGALNRLEIWLMLIDARLGRLEKNTTRPPSRPQPNPRREPNK